MSRVVYEVLPAAKEWMVRVASDSQWEIAPTKAQAIRRARELGSRYSEWRVRVLSATGAVEQEFTSEETRP